jgi:predicted Zn-dependent protease
MSGKTLRDLLILAAVFGAIWLIVAIAPWKVDSPGMGISVEKEQTLGEMIVEDWMFEEGQLELVTNPTLDSAMHLLNDRLLSAMDESQYDHHIWIVKENQINAYTLPGGYILVNSGLIEFSDSPEEVAAVIAHELGHVEHRHVVSRLIKEFGLTIVFSVLSGGDPVLLSELSRSLLSNMFNRKQEEEADEFSWQLMVKAGLDPRILATFFRKLKDEYPSMPEEYEFMSTHPHHNARIRSTLERSLPDSFNANPLTINWEKVKASLHDKPSEN